MEKIWIDLPWRITRLAFEAVSGRVSDLEAKRVRSTRWVSIAGPATSGSLTLPAQATIVLDDFEGTVDAIVTGIDGGRPTAQPVYSAAGSVVAATLDGSGNWALSAAPATYPVALIYRVSQDLKDYDDAATDINGDFYLFSKPMASEVSYSNAGSGLAASDVQEALDEIAGTAAVSASPGFTWGGAGIKNAGTYLLNDTVPSNMSGRAVPIITGFIASVFIVASEAATCSFEILRRNGSGFYVLGTVSLTAERSRVDSSISAAVAYGDEIAVRIASGSCKDPILGLVIRGAA